ncbi:RagB/SusD family nutrient uptake outer membrane protein [Sphingobacterium phlebotomi]|uniref:RagB/SusD family nutrient uptake outer membrane protein n=2 Tax=Sphingobacterium phlebotomi TaxID=2605433 RepID=A0A5D4HDG3_9SPHI|nr:RagB/SusD family nutrient uptake outer membrane protein [Sphingobacterium phlebotomi]
MMKYKLFKYHLLLFLLSVLFAACDSAFLDMKPSKDIDMLNDLDDLENLLENSYVFGKTGSLKVASCDDYYLVSRVEWEGLSSMTERNTYVWNADLFGGEIEQSDWNDQYKAVFYANAVLDRLVELNIDLNTEQSKYVKGAALFLRAYAYYDLAAGFCEAYDEETAHEVWGLPLRTEAAIDEIESRSTLKETFDLIIGDVEEAARLLKGRPFPTNNRNRPSMEASYAMLARVYLSMRKYEQASAYADSCLIRYSTLVDYNDICKDCATPFLNDLDEVIFSSNHLIANARLTSVGERLWMAVDTLLIDAYDPNDLRLSINFLKNREGNFNKKRGYIMTGFYDFSGLATDEMYLIRAEGYARRGDVERAATDLEMLLNKRFVHDTFNGIMTLDANDLLDLILEERRKSLVWRGLRWSDLKRLNKEGRNIVLTRRLGSEEYVLPANDARYVFPIPDDEIALSNINQNIR